MTDSVDTVLVGGQVVTPNETRHTGLAIDDGTIVAIGDEEALPPADGRVDVSGKVVLPGVVDPHVHIDEVRKYAGTYESETRAAARGGVSTIVDFAWQGGDRRLQSGLSLLDGIRHKRERGENSLVDFGLHGVITREDPAVVEEIEPAIEEGVTSFKMYMSTYRTGISNGFIERMMRELAPYNVVAMVHTEDPSICEQRLSELQASGRSDATHFPESRPDFVEAMAADDALRMATEAGVKYYGMHTTNEKSADVIESFRTDGTRVRAETCTHYTVLTESAYESQGSLPLMAPPLRTQSDVEAIVDRVCRGVLPVVSSDHVPFERADKAVEPWWGAPYGVNSVQVGLSVLHDELVVERGLPYSLVARVKSQVPAETFGLSGKGSIEPGNDADLVVFDPDAEFTITAADNDSIADYSIYEGRSVQGRVEQTYLRGSLVVDDGSVVGSPGDGQFVHRDVPEWTPLW